MLLLRYFAQKTQDQEKAGTTVHILTILVELYAFIRLTMVSRFLYVTFRESYNGTLSRETKQILTY